jgi:group I intron endonuclease
MSIGIYKITSPSNKIYIGQSINIEKRWKKDYYSLRCITQTKLYNSFKKYGPENHKFEIIEECEEYKLLERETYWKIFYKVLEQPSLCCKIDGKGGQLSPIIRDKISKSLKGQTRSIETKNKISQNHSSCKKIYQYNLEGTLIKIWQSYSEAQRNNKGNIKNNILGKTKNAGGFIWLREEDLAFIDERVNKNINYINPKKGYKLKESTKKLMSQNIKNKKKNYKQNSLDLETIKEQYKILSTNQLAKLYNLSIPTIINYLKNKKIYEFRKNYSKINKIPL